LEDNNNRDEALGMIRKSYTVKDWPDYERPRERLLKYGVEYLTDAELLGIIIVKGHRGKTSIEIARELLAHTGSLRKLESTSYTEMKKNRGIGRAKYSQIKAALEIGSRLSRERIFPGQKIQSAQDVVKYYHCDMRGKKKEFFKVILMNVRHQIIKDVIISIGSLTETTVHPREVLKEMIRESAAAVIFLHNHPSGDPQPSQQDKKLTERLCQACELIGIQVLDHIIIGEEGYFSFAREGLLPT
jgi:DNA repair protein RadC